MGKIFSILAIIFSEYWLGREDSNLRMPASKAGALGHLATPHNNPQMAIKPTSSIEWRAIYETSS